MNANKFPEQIQDVFYQNITNFVYQGVTLNNLSTLVTKNVIG